MTQNIIVGIILAVAAVYLLKKFVFRKRSDPDNPCPGCGKCGGSKGYSE